MKIDIQVQTRFLPEHSDVLRDRYAFAYTVTIRNVSDAPARLKSRHWVIAHGDGHVEEVRGPGVIGETPRLKPGEAFSYTSGAVLNAPMGSMHGSYQMQTDDGAMFEAPIERFTLLMPRTLN
jgi:ApaG protein